MNTNEARAWKRYRYSDDHIIGGPSSDVHIMMKAEAKVMRRLQAETGLSEEEIRKVKKYRIELSKAQTTPEGPSDGERIAKRLLKAVTRELKLAKAHPDVVKAAMESAREADQESRYRYYSFGIVHAMKNLLRK